MFAFAPAGAYVGQWLESFREFPPRQKPGSFSLDRVLEKLTKGAGDKKRQTSEFNGGSAIEGDPPFLLLQAILAELSDRRFHKP